MQDDILGTKKFDYQVLGQDCKISKTPTVVTGNNIENIIKNQGEDFKILKNSNMQYRGKYFINSVKILPKAKIARLLNLIQQSAIG